jgi:EpsI family protein
MRDRRLRSHLVIAVALLTGATVLLNLSSRRKAVPLHHPLRTVPLTIGGWRGVDSPLPPRIVEASGVDDYLNRLYTGPLGQEVSIYIGYYKSQRTGDLIHSPRNCLPASGWEAVRTVRLTVALPAANPIVVNEFVIARGLQQDLILYWYQERGRVIPGEYLAKFWMVADALTRNRTDGALVRIGSPILTGAGAARLQAVGFLKAIYPRVEEIVPK